LGDQRGGSVYLRLSTRRIDQRERPLDTGLADQIIEGGYWLHPPADGASLVIAYMGVMAPQALEAHKAMTQHEPGAGLLAVTSADRLHRGWLAAQRERQVGERETTAAIERLLEPLASNARLVTVSDSHPAVLSWLGAVRGQRVNALGVEQFGQSGTLSELYETYQLDVASIVQACQRRN
jgi:pyruvate dehydrogenase E1 component